MEQTYLITKIYLKITSVLVTTLSKTLSENKWIKVTGMLILRCINYEYCCNFLLYLGTFNIVSNHI